MSVVTDVLMEYAEPISMTWNQMAQYLEIPLLEQYTLPVIAVKYGYTFSKKLGLFIKTATMAADGASATASASAGASAVFDSFVSAGNGVTRLGGGLIKNAVSNLTLAIKNGVTAAAGILATPLPTAFAALAPFAGVAAGVGLYKANPDFWEKMSRTLMPHLWKAIDGIGASSYVKTVVDSTGTTYMPKGTLDKLREMMSNYRSTWSGYSTGNFVMSHGTKGDAMPYNTELYEWQNSTLGTQLTDGMELIVDGTSMTVHITGTPKGYEGEFEGTIISILEFPPKPGPGTDLDTLIYIETLTNPNENRPIRWIWHPMNWTIEIKPYLVEIDRQVYIGVEIGNGENPWPPNIEWQPGRYILSAPVFPATEINYRPHVMEEELPQIEPSTITTPSIQVITGITPEGDPETEEYIPVPLPYADPSPLIMPNPNEFPEGYPYPIIAPALPNPTIIDKPQTLTDPETDPSQNPDPETDPEELTEIDIPTPTPAPPDTGETPENPLPVPYPIYTNARGLIKVYNPTVAEMREFGAWLWSTWSGNVADTLQKLFYNAPLDGVIGLHELYATPITVGRDSIRCGFLDSGVDANLVDERYSEINCGSVMVPEYYGNYLDYAPYTRISAYLPFVGIVNLEADDIIGHAVNVTYRVDAYTGSVAALITVAKNGYNALLYQYEGNAAVTIPLSAGSQNAAIQSALSIGASAIGGAISGGIAGAVGGAITGGIRAMGGAKASVAHSGAFGGTFGAMGVKKPYLIIRRPVKKDAAYRDVAGYPAYKRVYLSACSGFVRVRDCEFKSATATDEEKRLIMEALRNGVFV